MGRSGRSVKCERMLNRRYAALLASVRADRSRLDSSCFGIKPVAVSRIADLPFPVTAAKADWLVASHWIGFTPMSGAPDAASKYQAEVAAQFGNGYVLEHIIGTFGTPNAGFESDPSYVAEKAAHADIAGRLVAVHRLRPTARSLKAVLGDADFESAESRNSILRQVQLRTSQAGQWHNHQTASAA